MAHRCKLHKATIPPTGWQKFRRKAQKLILVSPNNPVRFGYFKSDMAIKREQERHLKVNRFVIHPFSTFRAVYEIFLAILYLNVLSIKPMSAFLSPEHYLQKKFFREYIIVLDVLCWIDIIMTFFTGFILKTEQSNSVELRFSAIAKRYIFSVYFICDVLSSFPKGIFYYPQFIHLMKNETFDMTIDLLMLLKAVRMVTLFTLVYRSAQYAQIKSKTAPFFVCVYLTTVMIIHWSACFQYGVPKLAVFLDPEAAKKSWIHRCNITKKAVMERYNHAFYKSSAYILGVSQTLYGIFLPEEYILGFLTYFIGKLLVAFVWLIIAMTILNARSIQIKFMELIDQLEEYMRRKKLPPNLRERIGQYYFFKYQGKYFKEALIKSLLPENIKKEVTMHMCKTMIKNVSVFSDLSNEEITAMVEHLVPEIFLPQDTIIQHGSYGDAMYILSSGTVAVYTRSGKEVCHLQDGAYFGEISLLLPDQVRSVSVMAIETSHVYRLNKRDFERYLLKNKKVLDKIMQHAEERLRESTQIEEAYKKLLFEQMYQINTFGNKK